MSIPIQFPDAIIVDCTKFVLGVKITIFEGDKQLEMQVPDVTGETLAHMAREHKIINVLLKGPEKFTAKLKNETLASFALLNTAHKLNVVQIQ